MQAIQKLKKDSIQVTQPLIDLLYPRRCPVCQDIAQGEELVCAKCKEKLPNITEPTCMKCGKPIEDDTQEYCSDCERIPKHYVKGFPLYLYVDPVRDGLTAMKYHNRREYARFYTEELWRRYGRIWTCIGFDAVIPVPVHKHKLHKRGYNQAELLAEPIAEYLGISMETHMLSRIVDTPPQKELNDIQRINNLKKAFQMKENGVNLKKVLLVDDIYTSGATVEACTLAMMQQGIREVYYTSVCIGHGY